MSTMWSNPFMSMNLGVTLNHVNVVRKEKSLPLFILKLHSLLFKKHNHLIAHSKGRCDSYGYPPQSDIYINFQCYVVCCDSKNIYANQDTCLQENALHAQYMLTILSSIVNVT